MEKILEIAAIEAAAFPTNALSAAEIYFMEKNPGYEILTEGRDAVEAYLILFDTIEAWEMIKLATRADCRKKGLATRLLAKAKAMGKEKIFLEVRQSHGDTIRFYEKNGFRTLSLRKNYYRDTNENAVIMVYEKKG